MPAPTKPANRNATHTEMNTTTVPDIIKNFEKNLEQKIEEIPVKMSTWVEVTKRNNNKHVNEALTLEKTPPNFRGIIKDAIEEQKREETDKKDENKI